MAGKLQEEFTTQNYEYFVCRWIDKHRQTDEQTCRFQFNPENIGLAGGIIMWKYIYVNPNKPWFLHVYSISHLKTLWKKEKLVLRMTTPSSMTAFRYKYNT